MTNSVNNADQKEHNPAKQFGSIREYFSGKTVFITGASGFLGRLLVEKLLRTCKDLEKIFILMRPKKEKSCEERFQAYFNEVIYDLLRRKQPNVFKKVFMIQGDCNLPNLGLSENDRQVLISEVNSIFHLAATVRFDEKIRIAANINVKGTKEILELAKAVRNLSSFIYVSTAFSFCPQKEIEEKLYQPKVTGEQLMTLVETFADADLDALTPTLLGEWPNTYSFTKSIAEDLVQRESSDLPIAVVRPSIVIATATEPLAGWTDNFYGVNGIIAGAGLGLMQTMHCIPDDVVDVVPADYVVNCCIAAAWEAANFNFSNKVSKDVKNELQKNNSPVYNYVSGPQKPLTRRRCMDLGRECGDDIPSVRQFWHSCFTLTSNKYLHLLLHYVLHMILAYTADFLARCVGKKPQLVKAHAKIRKFMELNQFFLHREWAFSNKNTQELWSKLGVEDKKDFMFDMGAFDWTSYFRTYIPGLRVYLVKDPLDTVPQGRVKAFRLKVAHYTLVCVFLLGLLKLLSSLWNAIFKTIF